MSSHSAPSPLRTRYAARAQFSPLAPRLLRLNRTRLPARARDVNATTGWDRHLLDRLHMPITRFRD